jgi:hypothetical protein
MTASRIDSKRQNTTTKKEAYHDQKGRGEWEGRGCSQIRGIDINKKGFDIIYDGQKKSFRNYTIGSYWAPERVLGNCASFPGCQ